MYHIFLISKELAEEEQDEHMENKANNYLNLCLDILKNHNICRKKH